ncbi:MAG: ATP-grasp domain-containing protein, partial [Planctomycetota bacterium]
DPAALGRLSKYADTLTFEFESIPPHALRLAADRFERVRPGVASLLAAADRLDERRALQAVGIRVAPFAPVDRESDLPGAIETVGLPAILKRRTGGYDGKGQTSLNSADQAADAWAAIGRSPAILERRIDFVRELSVVVCRSEHGATARYPIVENEHRSGILVRSTAPAVVSTELARVAGDWATGLADSLGHIGVLTLELFETPQGLIANEFAPRVHNSGHWTIEGAAVSQFENHARAVLGLPLGPTDAVSCCVMQNLIGSVPDRAEVLAVAGARLHDYRKAAKRGRKVGHITCSGPTPAAAAAVADQIETRTPRDGYTWSAPP